MKVLQRRFPQSLADMAHRLAQSVGGVLMLHRIVPPGLFSPLRDMRDLELAPEFLARLLSLCRKVGYEFIPVSELPTKLAANSRNKPYIAVTIDDGYLDNLKFALPVFDALDVPFTVFVTTGLINGRVRPWWYDLQSHVMGVEEIRLKSDDGSAEKLLRCTTCVEKESAYNHLYRKVVAAREGWQDVMAAIELPAEQCDYKRSGNSLFMNWDELRELAAHPMVEIGAHTVSHPRLVWLDEERCRLELTESRLELEAELGRPVVSVAYPHGSERDVPAGISKLARDSGYIIGFTTIPRHLNARDGDRLLTLPRVGIGDSRYGLWGNLAWILGWPQHFNAGLCSRLRAVEDFR